MHPSMITSSIISRVCGVIHKQPPKILYVGNSSLLDLVLKEFLPLVIQCQSIRSDLLDMSYDCYMSTDPIMHSQTKYLTDRYSMPNMVLIQNFPHKNVKKEDKYLISKNLEGTIKIFFDINVAKAWDIGYDHIIEYSVPYVLSTNSIRSKSIVILKTKNNKNMDILYQILKNKYPNTELLAIDSNTNLKKAIESLSEYKVAITIDNPYDSMVCGLSGCYTITNIPNNLIETHTINDFSNIESIIDQALNQYTDTQIHNLYNNIDTMINQLNNIIYAERIIK